MHRIVLQQQYGNNIGHRQHYCTLAYKLQPHFPLVSWGRQFRRRESILELPSWSVTKDMIWKLGLKWHTSKWCTIENRDPVIYRYQIISKCSTQHDSTRLILSVIINLYLDLESMYWRTNQIKEVPLHRFTSYATLLDYNDHHLRHIQLVHPNL
jgi:hypothetical protein